MYEFAELACCLIRREDCVLPMSVARCWNIENQWRPGAWAYSIRALLARNTRFLNNFRKWPRDRASIMDASAFFFFFWETISLSLSLFLCGCTPLLPPLALSPVLSLRVSSTVCSNRWNRKKKSGKKQKKKITFAATRDTRSKKCNSVSHATTSRKSISDGNVRRARPCK